MELVSFLVVVIVKGKNFQVFGNSKESDMGRVLREGGSGMQIKRGCQVAETWVNRVTGGGNRMEAA